MFSIDISDCSIEVLRLKKSLFGKLKVSSFGRIELEEGIVKNGEILDAQRLAEKLGTLVKGKKINFTLPDLRIFTHRVLVPLDISRSAVEPFLKEKVVEVIPHDFGDLAYDFKVVNETEKGKEVLFIAISKQVLIGYLKTFKILKLTPFLAIPESIAAFEIFKDTVLKEEVVLFVDIGGKTSTLSFFDKFGPLLTLNEAVETRILEKEIKKAASFLKKKYDKEAKRVILGGGRSLEIDGESFSKEIGIWTTKADKILEDKLAKIPLALNLGKHPPILFLNVLGLSLLVQRKEELDLLKETKNSLMKLIEQESKQKEAEEKEGEGKEDDKKDKEKVKEEDQEEVKEKIKEEVREEKVLKAGVAFLPKFFKVFSRFKRPLTLLIIIVTALFTFFGIFLFIKRPSTKKMDKEVPTPPPTVQPITPTPTIKVNRKDLKIKVLNGSGVPGRAKEVASILEELGYKVVATGNADSFDYEETILKIKEEKKNFLSLLTNDLEALYTVSSEEFILPEEEADVVVIVGRKEKE